MLRIDFLRDSGVDSLGFWGQAGSFALSGLTLASVPQGPPPIQSLVREAGSSVSGRVLKAAGYATNLPSVFAQAPGENRREKEST